MSKYEHNIRGGMEERPTIESIDLKKEVLVLFAKVGVIKPGDTGQIVVHFNCGGITKIDKTAKVA